MVAKTTEKTMTREGKALHFRLPIEHEKVLQRLLTRVPLCRSALAREALIKGLGLLDAKPELLVKDV